MHARQVLYPILAQKAIFYTHPYATLRSAHLLKDTKWPDPGACANDKLPLPPAPIELHNRTLNVYFVYIPFCSGLI